MSVNGLLKGIRKKTGSASFKESKLGSIDHYIDTGCYALNRIVSGSIHKGIPCGRIILISGESATGKSLIAAQIAGNAINRNNYDHIFYFDSEGGALKEFFENRGCDSDKIEHVPLKSIEDATVTILGVYNAIEDFKKTNPDAKFLCILDSLGALVATKLQTDAAKGKQVQDMGLAAKLKNNLMKGLMMPSLLTNTGFIVTNHVYDDPASMFPSKIKRQGGGKGIIYLNHVGIQCTKSLEKAESTDDVEAKYKGTHLKFFTIKNRIVKPFYETEMYIDFGKGIKKYDGLFEPAKDYGLLLNPKQGYYQIPEYSDKMFRKSQLLEGDEADKAWGTILDKFEEASVKDMQYSKYETIQIEDNVDEGSDSGEEDNT